MKPRLMLVLVLLFASAQIAFGQTTSFTYQGRLTDGGNPATGAYDFEFRLFDALNDGGQQGVTVQRLNVNVTGGLFAVALDFGVCASCFNGADRFLGIGVRVAGGGVFTLLAPRQQLTSNPYAIRSMNATTADGLSVGCVSCVTSSQIASVNGGTVTGTIPLASLPAGSASYIQNSTSQQLSSSFNISGDGRAGGTLDATTVNALTQYNIGGSRVLSAPGTQNLFAGVGAGAANTMGINNSFVGDQTGLSNTTGSANAFFGSNAGYSNTSGAANSFFGEVAGFSNTTGDSNAFFGRDAGFSNTTGSYNAFFGASAGSAATSCCNAFFGYQAGASETIGNANAFFGYQAGASNTASNFNAFFGAQAGFHNSTGGNNAFFGAGVGTANTSGAGNAFFGTLAGNANTVGDNNAFFGAQAGAANTASFNSYFGSGAGNAGTTGQHNAFFGEAAGFSNQTGSQNTMIGALANVGANNLTNAGAIGANALVSQSNAMVLGSINGINFATADTNVGIGTTAPASKLHISGSGVVRARINSDSNGGVGLTLNEQPKWSVATVNGGHFQIYNDALGQNAVWIDTATNNIGISTATPSDRLDVNGIIRVANLGAAGGNALCRNASNQISNCSSSLRYKTDVRPFAEGLDILRRLRPITFKWKDGGRRDIGFGAEEVERVEPLLTTRNDRGEIEGVKYGQLTTVLVNAVNEQQAQIARQQKEIEALRQLVCPDHPRATPCRSTKKSSLRSKR